MVAINAVSEPIDVYSSSMSYVTEDSQARQDTSVNRRAHIESWLQIVDFQRAVAVAQDMQCDDSEVNNDSCDDAHAEEIRQAVQKAAAWRIVVFRTTKSSTKRSDKSSIHTHLNNDAWSGNSPQPPAAELQQCVRGAHVYRNSDNVALQLPLSHVGEAQQDAQSYVCDSVRFPVMNPPQPTAGYIQQYGRGAYQLQSDDNGSTVSCSLAEPHVKLRKASSRSQASVSTASGPSGAASTLASTCSSHHSQDEHSAVKGCRTQCWIFGAKVSDVSRLLVHGIENPCTFHRAGTGSGIPRHTPRLFSGRWGRTGLAGTSAEVLVYVDVAIARSDGVRFLRCKNGLALAPGSMAIPPRCLWRMARVCDAHQLYEHVSADVADDDEPRTCALKNVPATFERPVTTANCKGGKGSPLGAIMRESDATVASVTHDTFTTDPVVSTSTVEGCVEVGSRLAKLFAESCPDAPVVATSAVDNAPAAISTPHESDAGPTHNRRSPLAAILCGGESASAVRPLGVQPGKGGSRLAGILRA